MPGTGTTGVSDSEIRQGLSKEASPSVVNQELCAAATPGGIFERGILDCLGSPQAFLLPFALTPSGAA